MNRPRLIFRSLSLALKSKASSKCLLVNEIHLETTFSSLHFLGALLLAIGTAAVGHTDEPLRIATFNVSLFGDKHGALESRLKTKDDPQIRAVAEIIQRVRPDVLLLNEFDYPGADAGRNPAELLSNLQANYLAISQSDGTGVLPEPQTIHYEHQFTAPVNTGVHSGRDLDKNGEVDAAPGARAYGGDCWGYGAFPGQYGMAILSRYPIDTDRIRTFQGFLWKDMPNALLPDDASTPAANDWYDPEALDRFPLSSKSHWDVPFLIDGRTLHLLASHPTPPVYDGAEDRNGRRNHDEIRFWADYVTGGPTADYIYDDRGGRGGLGPNDAFVIVGDLNSDPSDGDGSNAIRLLLEHPKVQAEPVPASAGGAEQAATQGGANRAQTGDPSHDTCDPPDMDGPGNLRLDYVLPSTGLRIAGSGVFWPEASDPLFPLVGTFPFPSSDHRLVWVDVDIGPGTRVRQSEQP